MAQLYFYYSAMNAGKSTSLLQSNYNYRERGMQTVIFTSSADDRAGQGIVSSRIGLSEEAHTFDNSTNMFDKIKSLIKEQPYHCVFIDEAQFLSADQVDQLAAIVDKLKVPVLCYGIRTDFQGQLFTGSQRLLAISDKLTELKTICQCGKKASMVLRIDENKQVISDGDQVVIGGNDQYVSVCRKHFSEGKPFAD